MIPQYLTVEIQANKKIATDIYAMKLHAPSFAATVHPGQFLMLYLPNGELLLPRPISICDADNENITLVYQVVGAGTRVMAEMKPGDFVKILAPLGKGFLLGKDSRVPVGTIALVGGGIGVAPLLLLAKTLSQQGRVLDVYLGFRSDPFLVEEFREYAYNIYIATDDGSHGHKGNIIGRLDNRAVSYDEFMACGPRPMLTALHEYSVKYKYDTQVSMEERMACGLGTCVGCVLEVEGTNIRICTEGPVFYSDQIKW